MKTIFLILNVFLMSVLLTNCVDYADEDITINGETPPGFAVYKTQKNYFDYVAVGIDSNGHVTHYPAPYSTDLFISKDKSGNYYYNQRWKLKSGFVVSREINTDEAFTNVTYDELVENVDKNSEKITHDWFVDRIIDTDPFTEYYYLKNNPTSRSFTLGEINEMIENGTIETVFTKIK